MRIWDGTSRILDPGGLNIPDSQHVDWYFKDTVYYNFCCLLIENEFSCMEHVGTVVYGNLAYGNVPVP
jgi:hypothetical protein